MFFLVFFYTFNTRVYAFKISYQTVAYLYLMLLVTNLINSYSIFKNAFIFDTFQPYKEKKSE